MQSEAEIDVLEMRIAGENVGDAKILHHDHAGEINEGDVGFVVILLPQLPSVAELLWRDMHQHMRARVGPGQQSVNCLLCLSGSSGN